MLHVIYHKKKKAHGESLLLTHLTNGETEAWTEIKRSTRPEGRVPGGEPCPSSQNQSADCCLLALPQTGRPALACWSRHCPVPPDAPRLGRD